MNATPSLARRGLAEFIGTGMLVAVVVGSGIMAARLSPHDIGLELLENAAATAAGLTVLILLFGPVSGAHFNPVVSVVDWALGRTARSGLPGRDLPAYLTAQVAGGIGGAALANLMFALPAVSVASKERSGGHLWLGEVVATAGLVALIFALARTDRARLAPAAVGVYIGAAYWFTSSTSFANPAVTIARAFSDTFAGIAPASVAPFVAAQLAGALAGAVLVLVLYPAAAGTGAGSGDVVITMGCGDACPVFPGTTYQDWDVADPAGQDIEQVRAVRDDLERRVRRLLDQLHVSPKPEERS